MEQRVAAGVCIENPSWAFITKSTPSLRWRRVGAERDCGGKHWLQTFTTKQFRGLERISTWSLPGEKAMRLRRHHKVQFVVIVIFTKSRLSSSYVSILT